MSRQFTTGRDLAAALVAGEVPGTVTIEVSTDLLAAVMGQRFTAQNGDVLSIETVRIVQPRRRQARAEPVVLRQVND